MNRLNCRHQNRYLPWWSRQQEWHRYPPTPPCSSHTVPSYSLLIQSRLSYPPSMRLGGEPPPKCKTPPANSSTTIPLCHAGKSVADQEQKAKATEKQKGQKGNRVKTPPSRLPPQIRRFCYMPLLPRNTYSWMLSSYRCFGRSSRDDPAGRFIAFQVPCSGRL